MGKNQVKCEKCGQIDTGQTGERHCSECGLPMLHDEVDSIEENRILCSMCDGKGHNKVGSQKYPCRTCDGEGFLTPAEIPRIGATGNFPEGKLKEDDEGELNLNIVGDLTTGQVVINFGKSLRWLAGKTPKMREIGEAIIEQCDIVESNMAKIDALVKEQQELGKNKNGETIN